MALPATLPQQQVIDFIRAFMATEGYPPTRAEMARHFGVNTNAIEWRLRLLERKGLVRLKPKTARGISLPAQPAEA